MRYPLWVVALTAACFLSPPATGQTPPLNFVVIVTDDQRWDTVWSMPTILELAEQGVHFTNAYVSTPLCSPSRASFLSGGYLAHNTGVRDNGGVDLFFDADTLATRMQAAGYATGLVGKYINPYGSVAPYVPPGWTRFVAHNDDGHEPDWFSYDVTIGSTSTSSGTGTVVGPITQYLTDYQRDQALAFIEDHAAGPFLLWFAVHAPHAPSTPAPGDEGLFPTYFYDDRAWGEADLSDKPGPVRTLAESWSPLLNPGPLFLRPLAAVDRAVAAIIARVGQLGLLDRTVFVFTSDNGFLWGEHRLSAKAWPYEEAIRVPLIVAVPGLPARADDHLVAANLDVGATVLDLAGLAPVGDGSSLVPLLNGSSPPWREDLLIESFSADRVWSGLRTRSAAGEWKYVEWSGGDRELYDLVNDPFEEQSVHADPGYAAIRDELATRLAARKGLTIVADQPGFALRSNGAIELPPGVVGQPFDALIPRWGGVLPLGWSVLFNGRLPSGLSLNTSTGRVTGTPTATAQGFFWVSAEDSSTTTHYGGPQSHSAALVYAIRNSACRDGIDNDGDVDIDLSDSGCRDATDLSEQPDCSDGLDQDGDGYADYPADPGCTSDSDPSERAACEDGLDNDFDSYVDYPSDPGCRFATSTSEKTQCQDGLDNDGQAGIDFDGGASLDLDDDGFIDPSFNGATPAVGGADSQCIASWGNREVATSSCGLGFEIAPILLALSAFRRRLRLAR